MRVLMLAALVLAGSAGGQVSEWKLYQAAIAAADGALRLNETSAAKRWLSEAPAAHRGWEWRYLNGLAEQSAMERRAHDSAVTGLAVSADGGLIASTSGDKTVKLWDARSGAAVGTLSGAAAATWSPAFRAGGAQVAAMGSDGAVRVWSVKEGRQIRAYEKLGNGLGAVAWSPDGRLLAAGTWTFVRGAGVKGWVHVWDFEADALLWKVEYGVKPIAALAFHPEGRRFAVGTWDGWVGQFEVDGGWAPALEVKHEMQKGTYPAVQAVGYAPDGRTLAVAAKDNLVRVYDARDGKLVRELAGHGRWANAVAYGPGGAWVGSGSSDETVRLWDVASGGAVRVLHGHTASVNAMAVTPDGARLVTGAADGTLRWWDAAWAAGERDMWTHGSDVYGLDVTADGKRAASAAWGGTLKLWEVGSGRELWGKAVHETSANAVAFSPDGDRMVSGGNDGRLQVVETATGKVLATWEKVSDGRAAGIAWSPDGRTVFCPTSRPTGRIWDVGSGRALQTVTGGKGA